MAQDPHRAPSASVVSLERPERLQTVLGQDKQDDCLSCRLVGEGSFRKILLYKLTRRCRGICIYRPRRIQLLLRQTSVAATGGQDLEERLEVWDEVTASWYYEHRFSFCGDGGMAAGELKDGLDRTAEVRSRRSEGDLSVPRWYKITCRLHMRTTEGNFKAAVSARRRGRAREDSDSAIAGFGRGGITATFWELPQIPHPIIRSNRPAY